MGGPPNVVSVTPLDIGKPESNSHNLSTSSIRITVKDLNYIVTNANPSPQRPEKDLYLLNNVNAYFNPGEMSALMGPSGSGKTTLLDLLAGRKTVGRKEGQVLFEGVEASMPFLRRFTGYVEQFDTLLGILTVEEMLLYTADLKRSTSESGNDKRIVVDRVIDQLGLDRCRHVQIGDSMRKGISGGQAKRTNIAIALVTTPKVLFLDEPTTGLDSYTSNEVMTVVQCLSRTGVTVCATIHSPTSFCFSLFDRVLMLIAGRVVYFGLQGQMAREHFLGLLEPARRLEVEKDEENTHNLAELLVNIITEADRAGKRDEIVEGYKNSPLGAQNLLDLDAYIADSKSTVMDPQLKKELSVTSATMTPWWWGVRTYVKYRTKKNYSDFTFLLPRIMDKMFIAIIMMTLYLNVGRHKHGSTLIQNVAAILFMTCATTGFVAASYIPALVLERPLFVRERNDGLFHVNTYLMSKMIDELMINSLSSLVMCMTIYCGIGLSGNFGTFWFTYFVGVATGIAIAYFVAAISPNMDVANALLPVYAVTLMLFAGFLIRYPSMPPWWRWYSYIDFCRYGWSAVMKNQFTKNNIIFLDNLTVLQYYGLEHVKTWGWIAINMCFFVLFYFLTLIVMTFKKYQSR